MNTQAHALIANHLSRPESSWSIGVRGAIAEFIRSQNEEVGASDLEQLKVQTPRGVIKITPTFEAQPIRYQDSWQFCLPHVQAEFASCRQVVTELGADTASVAGDFTRHILFDLGLGIPHIQACVRTLDPALLNTLRKRAGSPLLGSNRDLLHALLHASPHRVFVSTLGRIEVYGPIPAEHTPDGPHTHLLPQLLGSVDEGLDVRIPDGHRVCLSLYSSD